ncbi:hypothetical protein K439DRAFT_1626304 [Ramaria rubella]|nr:hypothetical protein K439DRAFT_1626304 [Ramaria rubella]
MTSPSTCASRQAILNHYNPGEGITSHVDLLTRFADGIIGVSLGSGTVMTFQKVLQEGALHEPEEEDRYDIYLPERSILVLTGDARYKWTHGIEGKLGDSIIEEGGASWIERGTRDSRKPKITVEVLLKLSWLS